MRDRNVGDDLRAMVQDVVDIGAQYVQTGREWLDERRDEMTHSNQPPHGPRRNRHRRGAGRHAAGPEGEGGQGYAGNPGYAGAGPDSYLDESVTHHTQRYAVPGDTQPDYYDRPGYDSTGYDQFDYDTADYAGAGRRSYAGIGPKNYIRSDSRITEDLCDQLTHDHDVDASDIEVKVAGGTATLEGTVAQRWMKHRAEDLADACSGVRHVENKIRVRPVADNETHQTSTSDPADAKASPARGSSPTDGGTTGL